MSQRVLMLTEEGGVSRLLEGQAALEAFAKGAFSTVFASTRPTDSVNTDTRVKYLSVLS